MTAASLVLCCAEDGEAQLAELIDALHDEGQSPEVLSGIDAEASMLTDAVDRLDGPALFVLCRTAELAPSSVRRLSGLFSARKGPGHQLMTVEIRPGRAEDVVRELRHALAHASVMAETPAPALDLGPGDSGRLMRDVVGPTAFDALGVGGRPSTIPEPTIDAEQLARELHEGMTAAEALLDRRGARPSPSPRPRPRRPVYSDRAASTPLIGHVPEDTIEKSTEPLEVTLERSTTGTGIPEPVIEDRAVGDPPSTDSGVRQVRRPTPAPMLHTSTEDEGPGATQEGAAASSVDLDPDSPDAEAVANEARPYGRLLLVLSAAGVLALVAMGVMQVMRSSDGAHERGSPSVAGATAEAAGPAVADGETAAEAAGTGPVEGADTGETEAGVDDDGHATGAAATGDSEGGRVTPLSPTPPPPPPTENQTLDASLAADIEAGSVHVLGHLYVTTRVPTRTTTWDDAEGICRGRSVSGVGGWRLPTKSQAYKLRKAGLLESASYWTRTTVGEDEVIAFDGATGRTTVWLKIEPNARAVCVRKRR